MKKTVIILSFALAIVTVLVIGVCSALNTVKEFAETSIKMQQQFEQEVDDSYNQFSETTTEIFLDWIGE